MFGPRAEGLVQAGPVLIGVLWDQTQPLAIVDEQAVGIGGEIGGWRITAIQPGGIEIERGERQEFLTPGTAFPQD